MAHLFACKARFALGWLPVGCRSQMAYTHGQIAGLIRSALEPTWACLPGTCWHFDSKIWLGLYICQAEGALSFRADDTSHLQGLLIFSIQVHAFSQDHAIFCWE